MRSRDSDTKSNEIGRSLTTKSSRWWPTNIIQDVPRQFLPAKIICYLKESKHYWRNLVKKHYFGNHYWWVSTVDKKKNLPENKAFTPVADVVFLRSAKNSYHIMASNNTAHFDDYLLQPLTMFYFFILVLICQSFIVYRKS